MTLYVYADGARVGLVEDIRSLQWLSEYQAAGEVKLVCSATAKNQALLADGRRLYCTDQPESALIRRTELADDGKDATLTVRAVLSAARWADRVVMATRQITTVETGMLELAEDNRRGLPGVTAPARGIPDKTDTQISWGSVLDAEITLAKGAGLGFREIFDPTTAQETFEVYQGTDRTQGEGYNGWFGDDIGNLASYTLAQGTDGWKNLAIVAGEGEGADRTVVTASLGDYTGDDRRELWVDAKDLTRRCQVAVSDGSGGYTYTEKTYSESEYKALLQARGLEKLAQCLPALEVDASLGQGTLVYGRDYRLGDLVPLKLTGCGLRMTARVSAVRTVYESTGRTVRAVLSDFAITSNFSAAKEAIG